MCLYGEIKCLFLLPFLEEPGLSVLLGFLPALVLEENLWGYVMCRFSFFPYQAKRDWRGETSPK